MKLRLTICLLFFVLCGSAFTARSQTATQTTQGITKLSVDPATTGDPIAVGTNDTRISTSTGGRAVVANQFAGADLGAKINAADAALGTSPGIIHVYGGGTLTTKVHLTSYHTLHFHDGTYTLISDWAEGILTEFGYIRLDDHTTVRGDGWGTIIEEPNLLNRPKVFEPYISGTQISGYYFAGKAKEITIRDLQIKGIHTQASNGTYSTVELGNCHNCTVDRLFLNQTTGNGITIGGGGYVGNHADGVTVTNCLLYQVQNQGINIVNGRNVHISHNTLKSHGRIAGSNGTGIDLETNTPLDIMQSVNIIGNVLDFRDSLQSAAGNGIAVQNSGTPNFGPVKVEGNTLIGANLNSTDAGKMTIGVFVGASTRNVSVIGNTIQRTGQEGIISYGNQIDISGNHLISAGDLYHYPIALYGQNTRVHDNNVQVDELATYTFNGLGEYAGANNNIFANNIANTISLLGASSRAPVNVSSAGVATLTSPVLAGTISVTGTVSGGLTVSGTTASDAIRLTPTALANLGTQSDGTLMYCSDCAKTTPCTGGGAGALAKRLNSAWDCN
jgi:hypothetical protein